MFNPNRCSLCDYTSLEKEKLQIHIQSKHEGKKLHECYICEYIPSQIKDLKSHIESVHKEMKHKCFGAWNGSNQRISPLLEDLGMPKPSFHR